MGQMIYCMNAESRPKDGQAIETIFYSDENGFTWVIERIANGFFVTYLGDPHFKDPMFSCELDNGQLVCIRNTGCIFFQDDSFDTFALVRELLKSEFTDHIWDTFEDMLTERFEHDMGVLESEIITGK